MSMVHVPRPPVEPCTCWYQAAVFHPMAKAMHARTFRINSACPAHGKFPHHSYPREIPGWRYVGRTVPGGTLIEGMQLRISGGGHVWVR